MLRAVLAAPETRVHRSKASGARATGCPLEVPRPPLDRFDVSTIRPNADP